jgi:hypothetical protein
MVSYNEYSTSLTMSTDNTDNNTDEQTHRYPDTIALSAGEFLGHRTSFGRHYTTRAITPRIQTEIG